VDGDVDNLKDKCIFIGYGRIIAGAKYKGEFEERLKSVVKVTAAEGDIVLFMMRFTRSLVLAVARVLWMQNILKPALARGELRAIGCNTLDEYQKYFEKTALERRFRNVSKNPIPKVQFQFCVVSKRNETHHKVQIKTKRLSPRSIITTVYY
jgi:ATP-dependent Clp protease ATP-binding subunit ClpB